MKNTSTEFNVIAENPFGAKYIHRIIDLTNNREIKDDIDDFLYSAMINDDDVFTIGNTCSATISFSIVNSTVNLNNKEIEVYQGLNVNGTIEYVKLGIFKVLKPKKDRNITRYQCVDRMTYLMNMPYSSNLKFPTTDVKILEEICTQVGISLVKNGLISHSISKKPSGYTRREIIAYMSQLQGKNARINSDGKLELIWYTDTDYVVDDNKIYYDGTSDVNSEIDYKVEYLECTVRSLDGTDETVIKAGSGTNGIKIENPFMTYPILYELANKLVGFTFRGAEFEFLGDFRLEVGDVVSVETNGEVYRVPIMQIEHKSDGGVVTTITSVGETDTESEIDLSSPNIHAMDRYYADLVLINKAMINKLSVDEADIKYLKVTQLEGIEANIENAVIENLEGKYISAEELDVEKARITVLEANSLTSDSAIIKDLQAGVSRTNTLIFGSASGDTIQTSFSNSVIAQLGDAQIESAMIKEIAADKITGLDLNTSKFTIHSENGRSIWKDNTISMYDDVSGSPRIQIGKDGSGDYNMYIWNNLGKLMFDALGVTEEGISRPIIRDDIVKDDANISASKLNIQSLFSTINDDTSYTLKSSKIYLDDEKQTLDVSFKVMSSNISGLQTTQASQGADISVIQGQISSKVWQQDITKAIDDIEVGGRNLLLNSNFTKGSDYWGVNSGVSLEIVSDSIYGNVAKVISSSNGTGLFRNADGRPNIKDSSECVFSFFAKSDTEITINCALNGMGLTNAKSFTIGTEWTRIVGHFTKTSDNFIPRIYGNGTFYIANTQLELGNVVTDWTIAPEDIDSNITSLSTKYSLLEQDVDLFKTTVSETYTTITDFNNLQIGGVNLVSGTQYWDFVTNASYKNKEELNIPYGVSNINTPLIEVEESKGYTVSVDIKSANAYTNNTFVILYYDNAQTRISYEWVTGKVGTDFTKVSKTFTTPTGCKYVAIGLRSNPYVNTYRHLMLEEGNKVTTWSPNPNDYQIQIEYNKTLATQTADKFNWLVESGTSSTDFTLTDRMAELTAQIINLNGNVKVSGEMLVDGAITAEKLAVDAIKSRNITWEGDDSGWTLILGAILDLQDGSFISPNLSWDKYGKISAKAGEIGKWSILPGGGLMAETDTGTAPGTLNRVYLQPFNNTDYEETWVISSQHEEIDSAGEPKGESWAYWYITGAGDFYTEGYVQTSMLYADMATIYGKTEIYGNGLELYYSTPYIDFHYNNNTTDHTARIVENSSGALTVINSISNASDRRLKQDFCSLDRRYLNALNLFKPISYRFIKGSDNLNIGFVAQDIEKALIDSGITDLPLISTDDKGMYALDYNQITALNTLGHIDHEERIQKLENELAIANALIQSLLLQQSSV